MPEKTKGRQAHGGPLSKKKIKKNKGGDKVQGSQEKEQNSRKKNVHEIKGKPNAWLGFGGGGFAFDKEGALETEICPIHNKKKV